MHNLNHTAQQQLHNHRSSPAVAQNNVNPSAQRVPAMHSQSSMNLLGTGSLQQQPFDLTMHSSIRQNAQANFPMSMQFPFSLPSTSTAQPSSNLHQSSSFNSYNPGSSSNQSSVNRSSSSRPPTFPASDSALANINALEASLLGTMFQPFFSGLNQPQMNSTNTTSSSNQNQSSFGGFPSVSSNSSLPFSMAGLFQPPQGPSMTQTTTSSSSSTTNDIFSQSFMSPPTSSSIFPQRNLGDISAMEPSTSQMNTSTGGSMDQRPSTSGISIEHTEHDHSGHDDHHHDEMEHSPRPLSADHGVDLEGFDLFADFSMDPKAKEDLMKNSLDLFPGSVAPSHMDHDRDPEPHQAPAHSEPSTSSMNSAPVPTTTAAQIVPVLEAPEVKIVPAQSKLERLLSSMRQTRTHAPPLPVTPSSTSMSPSIIAQPQSGTATPNSTAIQQTGPTSAVEFTPPGSPTFPKSSERVEASSASHTPNSARSTPFDINVGNPSPGLKETTPSTPIQRRPKPIFARPNTIPIYKKKLSFDVEPKKQEKKTDDAFAFTDDEDEDTKKNVSNEMENDEVEEEEIKPTPAPVVTPAAPKYIPRVGFERTDQRNEPTRKDLPTFVDQSVQRQPIPKGRSELLEYTEALRRRQFKRHQYDYIQSSQLSSNDCVPADKQVDIDDANKPPLPRLLICLKKKPEKESKRGRTKRRNYAEGSDSDDDDDWYGERRKKRGRGRPKKEDVEETYTVRMLEPSSSIHHHREQSPPKTKILTKKRILKNWMDRERGSDDDDFNMTSEKGIEGRMELKSLLKIANEYRTTEVRTRLSKFRPCTGHVQRGTFVVLKSELINDDCGLWKVDSLSMLQKFPPRPSEDNEEIIHYKNSSTYAGWCEQLQPLYHVVDVKIIRQNRTECYVETDVPLSDLFPAISDEIPDKFCGVERKSILPKEDVKAQSEARQYILQDDLRNALFMYLRGMLDGATTFDFFKKTEDEIDAAGNIKKTLMEKKIEECFEVLNKRTSFFDYHIELLSKYSSVIARENQVQGIDCQACGKNSADKICHLFCLVNHDPITMESIASDGDTDEEDEEHEMATFDIYACQHCCKYTLWMHRLIHYKYDLMKRIEERIFEMASAAPMLTPDQNTEQLKQSFVWMKEIISEYTDFWNDITSSPEDEAIKDE